MAGGSSGRSVGRNGESEARAPTVNADATIGSEKPALMATRAIQRIYLVNFVDIVAAVGTILLTPIRLGGVDSGGRLMAKVPGYAKAFASRWRSGNSLLSSFP
jgi:hypothetical protein